MLTPRLKCILQYVNSPVTADIGTDHAYVAAELIRSGRSERVIATDIRPGPLKIAAEHIAKYDLTDKIETRLGAGLSVLSPGEADTIIIAGMGGELISEIIRADEATARAAALVLQPMNSQYELRRFLADNDFTIEHEDLECEGHRVYNLLIVKSGGMPPFSRDIDYHLPPYLYDHSEFNMLIEKKEREFRKIVNGINVSKKRDEAKLDYYKARLAELEEIKNDNSKGYSK